MSDLFSKPRSTVLVEALGQTVIVGLDAGDLGILHQLGYCDGNAAATRRRVPLLRAATKLRQIMRLPVPDAPGLMFLAGIADPPALGERHTGLPTGYLAGSGLSLQRAFE